MLFWNSWIDYYPADWPSGFVGEIMRTGHLWGVFEALGNAFSALLIAGMFFVIAFSSSYILKKAFTTATK